MKIIGLYGPQKVGKTSVAQAIEHITKPYGFKRMSFAEPIRQMLKPLLPPNLLIPSADKDSPIELLGGKSVRDALKLLGTEWGRALLHEDLWVNVLLSNAYEQKYKNIVIDDLRMDNEFAMIKRLGGMTVLLSRDGVVANDTSHTSELQWPKWTPDFRVINGSPTSCAQEVYLNAVQFFNL